MLPVQLAIFLALLWSPGFAIQTHSYFESSSIRRSDGVDGGVGSSGGGSSQWLEGVRNLVENCPVRSAKIGKDAQQTPSLRFVNLLAECARGRALRAIDDLLRDDVIPIVDGLDFVRFHGKFRNARADNFSVTSDISKLLRRVRNEDESEIVDEQRRIEDVSLREGVARRLGRLLHTHVIKLNPERLATALASMGGHNEDDVPSSAEQPLVVESRGRRRRKKQQMQLMPLIMMGVLLMSTVLIPMGFQFLAVLGGKALILAKMALMLSSIQGLKKIATSGVNYGLYHSPVPEWHERSDAPPPHNAPVYQPTSYLEGFVG